MNLMMKGHTTEKKQQFARERDFHSFFQSSVCTISLQKKSIKILKSITLLNTVETHSACSAAVLRRTSPRPEESTSMVPLTLVRGRPCASNRSSGLPSPADSLLHTAIFGAIDGSKRSSCGCRPNMSNMLQSCSTTGIPFWSQFISSLPEDKLNSCSRQSRLLDSCCE